MKQWSRREILALFAESMAAMPARGRPVERETLMGHQAQGEDQGDVRPGRSGRRRRMELRP